MSFFARPNLDNVQFKQLTGSTLTLSGTTQIVKQGGLQLPDGTGGYIPIVTSGASNQNVLTYIVSGGTCCLTLLPPSSGASTGKYTCASPTTCSVGGLCCGTPIYNCGIDKILEMILVPTVPPVVTPITFSYSISPSTTIYEVGCSITITGCTTFGRGTVNPQYYCTSGCQCYRSGLPNTHKYFDFCCVFHPCACTALNDSLPMPVSICAGNNVTCASVCYDAGVMLYDSASGTSFISPNPLPAGVTSVLSQTVCGILPWYWGKKSTNNITAADVAAGTKCVGLSTGTLPIIYNSSCTDYLWFAVPNVTPAKTCWYVNSINNGGIGGVGNLFAASCPQTVCSLQGCWTCCVYMVYVSCYSTGTATGIPMCIS